MESRQQRIQRMILKWMSYAALLILVAVLQTTPGFLQFGAVKPVFIVSLCVAVAIYEGEFAGGLFGLVGGLTWDYTAGRIVGMFAIFMLLLCFFVSVLEQLYLRRTRLNYFLITGGSILLALSQDFLFLYYMPSYEGATQRYLSVVLPSALLSAVLALPLYHIVRSVHERFNF